MLILILAFEICFSFIIGQLASSTIPVDQSDHRRLYFSDDSSVDHKYTDKLAGGDGLGYVTAYGDWVTGEQWKPEGGKPTDDDINRLCKDHHCPDNWVNGELWKQEESIGAVWPTHYPDIDGSWSKFARHVYEDRPGELVPSVKPETLLEKAEFIDRAMGLRRKPYHDHCAGRATSTPYTIYHLDPVPGKPDYYNIRRETKEDNSCPPKVVEYRIDMSERGKELINVPYDNRGEGGDWISCTGLHCQGQKKREPMEFPFHHSDELMNKIYQQEPYCLPPLDRPSGTQTFECRPNPKWKEKTHIPYKRGTAQHCRREGLEYNCTMVSEPVEKKGTPCSCC